MKRDCIDIEDFSEKTGLPYDTVLLWCNSGKIKSFKSEGERWIPKYELEILRAEIDGFKRELGISND